LPPLGQLPPTAIVTQRNYLTQDKCHPDNCYLGQLPPKPNATWTSGCWTGGCSPDTADYAHGFRIEYLFNKKATSEASAITKTMP